MSNENKTKQEGSLDWFLFTISLITLACIITWGNIDNEGFKATMIAIKTFIISNFSWLLIIFVNSCVAILFYLICSKYGVRKLGKPDDKPEINTFSWIALLIGCGATAGFLFWPIVEPLWHYMTTPYLVKSNSPEAMVAGRAIGLFHWGFHLWGIFCITGLCLGYTAFRHDKPLTIASSLIGLLGEKTANGWIGRIANLMASISTLCGVGATMSLNILIFTAGVLAVFGIKMTPVMQISFMILITIIYTLAAFSGLTKGIKWLGDINAYLCFGWLFFVLFMGQTSTLLDGMVETIGFYFNNFMIMATFADSSGYANNWHGDWSVMYTLWNTAWAPLVGGFLARISRGRSIREFVLGTLIIPTVISAVWFGVIGTQSQLIVINEVNNLKEVVAQDPGLGLYSLIDALNGGFIVKVILFITCCTLLLTSADAAALYMAILMCRGALNPKPSQMLLWGIVISCLGLVFYGFGGINGVQTAGVVAGSPFLFVLIAMIVSLFKTLQSKEDANICCHKIEDQ